MTDKLNTLMDMLLDRARKAGADAADGIVAGGLGQEVSVRLGEVESVERSEDHEIGLRVLVGKRNAMISSSRIDEDPGPPGARQRRFQRVPLQSATGGRAWAWPGMAARFPAQSVARALLV